METKTTQLPITNEIVSVLQAKKFLDDRTLLAAVRADPAKALAKPVPGLSVRTVQNTRDTMNICIPDYQAIRDGTAYAALDDKQMAQVSGGEIFLGIIIGIIAATATVTAVVGIAVTVADQDDNDAVDGSIF